MILIINIIIISIIIIITTTTTTISIIVIMIRRYSSSYEEATGTTCLALQRPEAASRATTTPQSLTSLYINSKVRDMGMGNRRKKKPGTLFSPLSAVRRLLNSGICLFGVWGLLGSRSLGVGMVLIRV